VQASAAAPAPLAASLAAPRAGVASATVFATAADGLGRPEIAVLLAGLGLELVLE
jgi:hypothetical protein